MALGRAEIDVAAIDAVHDRAQFGALRLGEGIVLGTADEGEGLSGEHRIGVAGAGLDRDDLHRDVGLGEIIVGHRDIHRQIAGAVHRFGDQQFFGRGAGDEGRRREGEADSCAKGRGRLQKFSPIHDVLTVR